MRYLAISILLLVAGHGTVHAIDLRPKYSDKNENGIARHQMFFFDGTRKIGLIFNYQTQLQAAGNGTLVRFLPIPDASLVLRPSPMSADEPFSGASLERYREAAHRLLPPRITHVKPLGETPDALPINGWQSYRFVFSFAEGDADRMCSATFVNLNESEQIVLITTANQDHFNDATERVWLLMRTWHVLPPAEPTPAGK
jgi:hypothetical protein